MSINKFSASHWGAFSAEIDGDIVRKIIPFRADYAPSKYLSALCERARSDSRIRSALVRKSVLEKGFLNAPKNLRGKEELVPISWDVASKLAADELKRIYADYGPSAIYGGSYGWNCVGSVNNPPALLARMLNILGGFVDREQTYSTHAISVISPYISGVNEATARPSDWENVLKNSSLVVFWGADILRTNEIAWNVATHKSHEYIKRLKSAKIKTISINPLRNQTAKYLDSEQIFICPGTDAFLALSICYALIERNLVDLDFVNNYSQGFDEFREYLFTQKLSPKRAEQICGIKESDIYSLAQEMASNRTMIMAGWGMQRAYLGEQPHRAIICLAVLLGQIGLDGGGYGFNYHYSQGGANYAAANILGQISAKIDNQTHQNIKIPVSRIVDALKHPNEEYFYNGKSHKYPDIRCIYWAGGNFMHHHPGRNEQLKAFEKLESLIVQDCFLTASAQHADLILPATCEQERYDIARSECGEYIFAMQPLFAPFGEAKNDFDIFASILAHFDKDKLEQFSQGRSHDEWVRYFYNEARTKSLQLPSYEEFCARGFVRVANKSRIVEFVKFKELRNGELLNTPSGKFELASKDLEGLNIYGIGKFAEASVVSVQEKYPLILISAHAPNRLHSQLDNAKSARQKISDKEMILMHPQDAQDRALKDGDIVLVRSEFGEILCGVKISTDIAAGVVCVHQGAWYLPDESGRCQNGDVNVLISNEASSQLACANRASAHVQVGKFVC